MVILFQVSVLSLKTKQNKNWTSKLWKIWALG